MTLEGPWAHPEPGGWVLLTDTGAGHALGGSGCPHLERAVQVGVVVEVALPLGAAEGLQVPPQPAGRDQGLGLRCPDSDTDTKPVAMATAALQGSLPSGRTACSSARCPSRPTNKCAHGSCPGQGAISTAWLLAQVRPGASPVPHTIDPASPVPGRAPVLLTQGQRL